MDRAVTVRLLLVAILLTGISGIPGLFFPRKSPLGERVSAALLGTGCLLGLFGAFACLLPNAAASFEAGLAGPRGGLAGRVGAPSAGVLPPVFLLAPVCS